MKWFHLWGKYVYEVKVVDSLCYRENTKLFVYEAVFSTHYYLRKYCYEDNYRYTAS